MNFEELEKTDVTKHIEKKGRFSYLSWPFAVSEFRKKCPEGFWRIKKYGDNSLPYVSSDKGAFVSVTVYPDKESDGFEQIHPVLNHQNKPIVQPNPFEVNTSIQRCLVKAIAIATGIGLHIYAGEDLQTDEPVAKKQAPKKRAWTDVQKKGMAAASDLFGITDKQKPMFIGWIAKKYKVDTFNDIPNVGKADEVVSGFGDLWDEFVATGGVE
jgi:hypothetical protein